jgi:hypothetical protein
MNRLDKHVSRDQYRIRVWWIGIRETVYFEQFFCVDTDESYTYFYNVWCDLFDRKGLSSERFRASLLRRDSQKKCWKSLAMFNW